MRPHALCLFVALVVGFPNVARAGDNDLVLSRLSIMSDGRPVQDNQAFRSLASELGVVIAPKFLAAAESLGYSGFQFSSEISYTTITSDGDYWCATEESSSCASDQGKPSGTIPTIGLFVRKGVWLPLPSFEVGAGAFNLVHSRLWAAQVFAKLALHEGFHDWPLPSLAVRGAASTLVGSEQMSLTVASFDISVSKPFGIQGTVNLEPYAGWNYLWIIPRSEVIDKAVPPEGGTTEFAHVQFAFAPQQAITRSRLFAGFKLKYNVLVFSTELNVALSGKSIDDTPATQPCGTPAIPLNQCDAQDRAGTQYTLAASVALGF
ncbi:MAG: hypothetical protein V2A73_00700 [Pseudomonadota bacterium]